MNDPRLWFGPKRFGWGYGPRTWEGWALIIILILAAIAFKHFA